MPLRIICVLGMHRSGTSVAAGVLLVCVPPSHPPGPGVLRTTP